MVKSVLSQKVEIRNGASHAKGMFAKEAISQGEIVFIKGGHILKYDQIFSSGVINSYHPISDEYFIGSVNAEEEDGIKLYINHSCNPNCGLRGEITFVAIKDIRQNEELSIDYAFLDNEDYEFKCACGQVECRKVVTGRDWRIRHIQDCFYEYFAAYLKEKIDAERNDRGGGQLEQDFTQR